MAAPSDNLKWFGQGFDGFPRRLPEDCMEYSIYILDPKLQDLELRKSLRQIQAATNALIKRLLEGFIWQREAFGVELVRENGLSFLRGRTVYGDSVEDEWLIVYLLREISKQFPATWTKVVDTDGEFLLIESAAMLPRWLNPEVADNRVWIHEGQVRVIPKDFPPSASDQGRDVYRPLLLRAALEYLRSGASGLLHLPLMEEQAFDRIRGYPEQIVHNLHTSIVTIPRKVAHLLHQKPSLISPAVDAFYLRDPIALQPLQKTGEQDLEFVPEDFVSVGIKFTRVGYAQMKSQHFPTPLQWAKVVYQSDSTTGSRAEMGMKIACGFEMLLRDPARQDDKTVREIKLHLGDLQNAEEQLPTDAEIATWNTTEDDDSWMNIDFRDFDNELSGKRNAASGKGFGDKTAEENLRKMVAKFESFLQGDDADLDASADLDDMDRDNDDDSDEDDSPNSSDVNSEGEDKNASFDEDEFTEMMREMMGMPKEAMAELIGGHAIPPSRATTIQKEIPSDRSKAAEESDDEEDIRDLSRAMEAELKAAGALQLNGSTGKAKQLAADEAQEEETDEDEDDIDENFNLVKNMLESFKSQGGMAGPGGNLMGMMGLQLPRDEEESFPPEKS